MGTYTIVECPFCNEKIPTSPIGGKIVSWLLSFDQASPCELAEACDCSLASVCKLIQIMEAHGIVKKTGDSKRPQLYRLAFLD